jgi:hypothetical protein
MIIDYSTARPSIAALKAAGVTAVMRYLGWDSEPGYASIGKNLLPPECRALLAAGVAVGVVFEYGQRAPLEGAPQGRLDGALAGAQLTALAAPARACCYFAVDFDVPDYASSLPDTPGNAAAKLGAVARYFSGARAALPSSYRVGVYGGYYAVKRVLDARLAVLGWQTGAWSGQQLDRRAVLYQSGATTIGGADVNLHEGTSPDFGQWPRPLLEGPPMQNLPGHWHQILSVTPTADGTGWVAAGIGTDGCLYVTTGSHGAAGWTWAAPRQISGPADIRP